MIDGYALVEIAPNKKGRLKSLCYLDVKLDQLDFDPKEVESQLLDQLPEEYTDVLMMVFFTFECKTQPNWTGNWDNEEVFEMVSFRLLKEHYKEFYREQVTDDLYIGISGYHALEAMIESVGRENNYYAKIVEEWEALYEETFVPSDAK